MPYLVKNSPISNKIQIGTANKICEITSGGVNIIPNTNAIIIIYDLFSDNSFFVVIPDFIMKFIIIGI